MSQPRVGGKWTDWRSGAPRAAGHLPCPPTHRRGNDWHAHELVRTTRVGLQPSCPAPVVTDLHPLPRLRIDPEQIETVLVNLVLNAREAVGPAGEIRVITERLHGWAVLSVHDNGCGMSREFVEQSLFQPFRTTKRQGLGIGLFQSKMIVEVHQGRIEVESEEGQGSTFQVLLPC